MKIWCWSSEGSPRAKVDGKICRTFQLEMFVTVEAAMQSKPSKGAYLRGEGLCPFLKQLGFHACGAYYKF